MDSDIEALRNRLSVALSGEQSDRVASLAEYDAIWKGCRVADHDAGEPLTDDQGEVLAIAALAAGRAACLLATAQPETSLERSLQAIGLFERLGRDGLLEGNDTLIVGLVGALGSAARVYADLGDGPRAEQHFGQAIFAAEQQGATSPEAAVLLAASYCYELGRLREQSNDLVGAVAAFSESVRMLGRDEQDATDQMGDLRRQLESNHRAALTRSAARISVAGRTRPLLDAHESLLQRELEEGADPFVLTLRWLDLATTSIEAGDVDRARRARDIALESRPSNRKTATWWLARQVLDRSFDEVDNLLRG